MTSSLSLPKLRSMQFLRYWLWPNPAGWHYQDSRVLLLLCVSIGLILLSFAIRFWRTRLPGSVTRTLTSGWSLASLWFGIVALVLTVSRVETIQFLSMRLLWAVWILFLALYVLLQVVQFKRRHYTVVKQAHIIDEREKYLPKRKR